MVYPKKKIKDNHETFSHVKKNIKRARLLFEGLTIENERFFCVCVYTA